jgi:hypothetical protein
VGGWDAGERLEADLRAPEQFVVVGVSDLRWAMTPEERELEQQRMIREYLATYRPVLPAWQPKMSDRRRWAERAIVDERDHHTGNLTPKLRGGISTMRRATYAEVRARAAKEAAA